MEGGRREYEMEEDSQGSSQVSGTVWAAAHELANAPWYSVTASSIFIRMRECALSQC